MKYIITVIVYLLLSALGCLEVQACKHQITLRADKSFSSQVIKTNTKYFIEDDFDLYGQKVIVPKGCTLIFKGGCLRNGELIGENTGVEAAPVKIFDPTLLAKGAWKVKELRSEWFGAKGDGTEETAALAAFFNFPAKKKILKAGVYGVYELHCDGMKNTDIYAYGATLQYLRTDLDSKQGVDYSVLSNFIGKKMSDDNMKGYLHIYGLTIDGNSQHFVYNPKPEVHTDITTHNTLHLILLDELIIKDCIFKNSFMTAVMVHVCNRSEISNSSVINSGESVKYDPDGNWYSWEGVCVTDRIYTYDKGLQYRKCEECVVRDSYFENIGGSFASANCKVFRCYGNKVVDNRGYAFELSGEYENRIVDIHDNELWRVGSSAINLTYFYIPYQGTNTLMIYNNKFHELGYESHRTERTIKAFLMIYRNKGKDSNGELFVNIKNNLFELTPEAGSGLIKCDRFLFDNNICRGYNGKKNTALFYCEDDENVGSYYIYNNTLDLLVGGVVRIRSPKRVEVTGNIVTTSLAPAIVYIQDKVKESVFKVSNNTVTGTPSLILALSSADNVEIEKNRSTTIGLAISRNTSNVVIRCKVKDNSFSKVSETMNNIDLIDYGN